MTRRVVTPEEHYQKATAAAFADWAGEKKTNPKKGRIWDRAFAQTEVAAFIKTREWAEAKPKHFVELYARLHGEVYGVPPLDLKSAKTVLAAASLAAKALKEMFDGDGEELADFMRWVWVRQAHEEAQRVKGLRSGDFRITWRYQWGPKLVTDYRRAVMTAKRRRGGVAG